MKKEYGTGRTSLTKNIEKNEVSRGKVCKKPSYWLLIIVAIADMALVVAAILCVHHLFTETSVTDKSMVQIQTQNVSSASYGTGKINDMKNNIGKRTNQKKEEVNNQDTEYVEESSAESIKIQIGENAEVTGKEKFQSDNSKLQQQRDYCKKLYENQQDLLVLVNKDMVIASNYQQSLKLLKNKRVKVAQVMYQDLKTMLTDAGNAGGYSYQLVSGYRAASYQQSLVDRDINSYMAAGKTHEEALELTYQQVMPAGHSEHETGLALDITAKGNDKLDESQATEKEIQWLHENCWKYGFILRYPKDKEAVTGISYEPWHFRYVGREAAAYLYENQLTLEEFWKLLG